jgi:hypothetical protein
MTGVQTRSSRKRTATTTTTSAPAAAARKQRKSAKNKKSTAMWSNKTKTAAASASKKATVEMTAAAMFQEIVELASEEDENVLSMEGTFRAPFVQMPPVALIYAHVRLVCLATAAAAYTQAFQSWAKSSE